MRTACTYASVVTVLDFFFYTGSQNSISYSVVEVVYDVKYKYNTIQLQSDISMGYGALSLCIR